MSNPFENFKNPDELFASVFPATATLTITFEEAIQGCQKTIEYERQEPCVSCRGSGGQPNTSFTQCISCQGTGKVPQKTAAFGEIQTLCRNCEGEGQVPLALCEECGGKKLMRYRHSTVVNIPAGVTKNPAGVKYGLQIRVRGAGNIARAGSNPGDLDIRLTVTPDPDFKRKE